jgi:hypothetical protein
MTDRFFTPMIMKFTLLFLVARMDEEENQSRPIPAVEPSVEQRHPYLRRRLG